MDDCIRRQGEPFPRELLCPRLNFWPYQVNEVASNNNIDRMGGL